MLKFVSPCQVAQSYREGTLASVNFVNPAIQVSVEKPFIDQTTREKINNLLDDGDISPHQYQSFFKAARDFMVTIASYLLKSCPTDDSLLKHAKWIDFTSRLNHSFESVKYFPEIFPL